MPPDFRLLLSGALLTAPSLLAACNKPPPAVVPDEVAAPVEVVELLVAPEARIEIEPGDDHQPPRVSSAQFINPQRIRLTFTEPLGPSREVNPRQFRISVGYLSVDPEGYGYATYSDVNYHQGEEERLLVVRHIERYTDERAMGLDLSEPVSGEICAEIKGFEIDALEAAAYSTANPRAAAEEEMEMGLYLHYTSRGSAPVIDTSGNGLEPFGAAWALNYGAQYVGQNGQMPVARFDLLVKLTCFDLPAAYQYMEELGEAYEAAAYGAHPLAGAVGGIPGGVPGGVVGGTPPARPVRKTTPKTRAPQKVQKKKKPKKRG
jgi:hypothetical protein